MSSDEIIDITPQELAKCSDDDCLIIDTIRKPAKERNSRRTQQTNEINVLQMIDNLSRQIFSHDERSLAPARSVRSVSSVVQSSSSEIVYDSRMKSNEAETRNLESYSTASTSSSSAKTTTPKSGSKPGSKSSLECPICLESLEEIRQNGKQFVSTTCGHVFCDNCLNEHHKSLGPANFKCPTCRKKLTKAKIHTLYI